MAMFRRLQIGLGLSQRVDGIGSVLWEVGTSDLVNGLRPPVTLVMTLFARSLMVIARVDGLISIVIQLVIQAELVVSFVDFLTFYMIIHMIFCIL